jgi:HK97 gp10 family phage protein
VEGVEEFQAAMIKLESSMKNEVYRYLVSWAADVKAEATRTVPVRTGYLRSTIYARVKDWVVNIGADATYAYFVELGTKYMRAQPYLYPAIQKYLPELESLIVAAIEQAKLEVGL